MTQPDHAPLSHRAAVVLAAGTSAAVLVVELAALRLLAPYLGLTLETNTLVIGIALAAIAFGSWQGGRLADRVDPRRLVAPALGVSGAVVASTPTLLRATGELAPVLLVAVAMLTILVPGALLSAVVPMVTKLRLRDLDSTGSVVGQLSGVSTVGAIVGTVLTGFVLISRMPVSVILLVLGVLLVLGAALWTWLVRPRRAPGPSASVLVLVVAAGGTAVLVSPSGCDAETTYHCARVLAEPEGGGRTLVLDNLRHSYVDLDDPTHLEFAYVRAVAAAVDAVHPGERALRTHHVGGGGLTVPRWLAATRPGSTSTVSEIDRGVVALDRERLGLDEVAGVDVRIEDGRLGLREVRAGSRDVVVGDAFGGVSVPWHLTTREAVSDVRRILAPGGAYVANLIDFGTQDFARAEVATLRDVFDHVLLLGDPGDVGLGGVGSGGNVVVVASDAPVDEARLQAGLAQRRTGWRVSGGPELTRWVGDAAVLTDDFAPVDQLLQPSPPLA